MNTKSQPSGETIYDVLLTGFPGRTERGFLGWSTTVLIETEAGYALFDTGAAGDRPALLSALAARGLKNRDIKTVILSHLHFDHVANVECFPQAELVLHETERNYFEQHGADDPAAPLFLTESLLRKAQLSLISGEPEVLPGVRVLCTPGHTGGHISLMLTANGKCVVLAQDALKHRGEVVSDALTGAFDAEAGKRSINRILDMADVIVPGHDATIELVDRRLQSVATCREGIIVLPGGETHALTVQ